MRAAIVRVRSYRWDLFLRGYRFALLVGVVYTGATTIIPDHCRPPGWTNVRPAKRSTSAAPSGEWATHVLTAAHGHVVPTPWKEPKQLCGAVRAHEPMVQHAPVPKPATGQFSGESDGNGAP